MAKPLVIGTGPRRRRIIRIVFWFVAIVVTALAWAGLSLKDVLASIAF
jgi:hypothetical protein